MRYRTTRRLTVPIFVIMFIILIFLAVSMFIFSPLFLVLLGYSIAMFPVVNLLGKLNDTAARKCLEKGICPKCELPNLEFSEDVEKYSCSDCGTRFNVKGELQ